jgi:predicted CXXCH cytochrome family protein
LCLECHGPEAKPAKLESEHLVAIFDGKVKLPEDYFAKVPALALNPANITKVKTAINCMTCHQPHASAEPDLLVKDQVNNAAFCATCHTNLSK